MVAIALVLALAGCGGSDSDDAPVDTSAAEALNAKKHAREQQRERAAEQEAAAETKRKASGSEATMEINKMLAALPGEGGLVVGAPGGDGTRLGGGDNLSSISAWSTIKVPISERVLMDAGGPDGISSAQAGNIDAAITLSDNDAAASLFADLEAAHGGLEGASQAVGKMLREAGDSKTEISTVGRDVFTTYGQTDWSLEEQNKYMAALAGGCVSDPASRRYLFDQMSQVTSDTWGLGSAGAPAKWKGGWGPGVDGRYLVRQMGTMEIGGEEAVVTLAAIPDDGNFESAQAMATSIATWAATHLKGKVPESVPCTK